MATLHPECCRSELIFSSSKLLGVLGGPVNPDRLFFAEQGREFPAASLGLCLRFGAVSEVYKSCQIILSVRSRFELSCAAGPCSTRARIGFIPSGYVEIDLVAEAPTRFAPWLGSWCRMSPFGCEVLPAPARRSRPPGSCGFSRCAFPWGSPQGGALNNRDDHSSRLPRPCFRTAFVSRWRVHSPT